MLGRNFQRFLAVTRQTIGDQKKEILNLRAQVAKQPQKWPKPFSFTTGAFPIAQEVNRHLSEAKRMQTVALAAERYTHHASLAVADAATRSVLQAVHETRTQSLCMVLQLPREQQQTKNLVMG